MELVAEVALKSKVLIWPAVASFVRSSGRMTSLYQRTGLSGRSLDWMGFKVWWDWWRSFQCWADVVTDSAEVSEHAEEDEKLEEDEEVSVEADVVELRDLIGSAQIVRSSGRMTSLYQRDGLSWELITREFYCKTFPSSGRSLVKIKICGGQIVRPSGRMTSLYQRDGLAWELITQEFYCKLFPPQEDL